MQDHLFSDFDKFALQLINILLDRRNIYLLFFVVGIYVSRDIEVVAVFPNLSLCGKIAYLLTGLRFL